LPRTNRRTDPFARGAGHIRDEGALDAVDAPQRPHDLAGIHGRATDFEHVVGSAVIEQESVVVEEAEVVGGIETVGGEQLFSAATAYSAQVCGPRIWIMPAVPAGTGSPLSGSTMRTSMPSNGFPQLPQGDAGMSVSAG
jgi:hypothetical protein